MNLSDSDMRIVTQEEIIEALGQWAFRKGLLVKEHVAITLHVERNQSKRGYGTFHAEIELADDPPTPEQSS